MAAAGIHDVVARLRFICAGLQSEQVCGGGPFDRRPTVRSSLGCALCSSVVSWLSSSSPFDLGDRILMTGAEVVDNPGAPASWFVEGTLING